jgi:hypothetical protein
MPDLRPGRVLWLSRGRRAPRACAAWRPVPVSDGDAAFVLDAFNNDW